MGASLIQLISWGIIIRRSSGRKPTKILDNFIWEFLYLTYSVILTLGKKKAPTNFVPAVAVIRRGQVLPILIGRKGHVGGFFYQWMRTKTRGNDEGGPAELN